MNQPQTEALIRNIAGVVACHVPGVLAVGDGLFREFACYTPGRDDPGSGVRVRIFGSDVWLYIHLTAKDGANIPALKIEVKKRVQAALDNMLDLQATGITIEVQPVASVSPSRQPYIPADAPPSGASLQ